MSLKPFGTPKEPQIAQTSCPRQREDHEKYSPPASAAIRATSTIRRAEEGQSKLLIIEEECSRIRHPGWAAMIHKVYEVDPLTCNISGRSFLDIFAYRTVMGLE